MTATVTFATVSTRRADGSDLEVMRTLLVVNRFDDMEKWLDDWPRESDRGFVALDGEDVVGACWFRRLRGEDKLPELIIAVHPKFQGGGIGRRLLDAIVEQAADVGLLALGVAVDPNNEPIQRLLEHYDFRVSTRSPKKLEGYLALNNKLRSLDQ